MSVKESWVTYSRMVMSVKWFKKPPSQSSKGLFQRPKTTELGDREVAVRWVGEGRPPPPPTHSPCCLLSPCENTKYENTKTKIQIQKYKYKNTNTKIQIQKCKNKKDTKI